MQMLQFVECKLAKTIEQTAMPLALAIAITRLLSQNVRNLLGDGINFADIRDLELSRIQRLRKRHGLFCLLKVDRDWVQIGPDRAGR